MLHRAPIRKIKRPCMNTLLFIGLHMLLQAGVPILAGFMDDIWIISFPLAILGIILCFPITLSIIGILGIAVPFFTTHHPEYYFSEAFLMCVMLISLFLNALVWLWSLKWIKKHFGWRSGDSPGIPDSPEENLGGKALK